MTVLAARALDAKALGEEAAHGLAAHRDGLGAWRSGLQKVLKAKRMLVAHDGKRVFKDDQTLLLTRHRRIDEPHSETKKTCEKFFF